MPSFPDLVINRGKEGGREGGTEKGKEGGREEGREREGRRRERKKQGRGKTEQVLNLRSCQLRSHKKACS